MVRRDRLRVRSLRVGRRHLPSKALRAVMSEASRWGAKAETLLGRRRRQPTRSARASTSRAGWQEELAVRLAGHESASWPRRHHAAHRLIIGRSRIARAALGRRPLRGLATSAGASCRSDRGDLASPPRLRAAPARRPPHGAARASTTWRNSPLAPRPCDRDGHSPGAPQEKPLAPATKFPRPRPKSIGTGTAAGGRRSIGARAAENK